MYNLLKVKEIIRKFRFSRAEFVYLFLAKRDNDVKELLKLQIASGYLLKRYVKPYFNKRKVMTLSIEGNSVCNTAWLYWAQGIDKAPDMVKRCVDSSTQAFTEAGWNVKILDKKLVKEYTDLPDYIWDKYESGIISDAHFSDLIRLNLLINRGGCWCDATVLFTGVLPQYIYEHELFLFRGDLRYNSYINISSWMIYSMKSHPILVAVYNIFLEYWKNENILIQYFAVHLVFKLVTDYYSEYWKTLPIYSNVLPHLLQQRLLEPYSEAIMKEICSITPIHKLYWRTPVNLYEKSFYNMILKDNELRKILSEK